MRKKVGTYFIFISGLVLMIWGVVGIIISASKIGNANLVSNNLYGEVFTLCVACVEFLSGAAAYFLVKFKNEILKMVSFAIAFLLGIIFIAYVAMFIILIYGNGLGGLDWFTYSNFAISTIVPAIYVVGIFVLNSFRKLEEKY